MKRDLLGAVVGLFAIAAVAGCDNPVAANQLVVLDVVKLDVPATVSAGSSLTVVLTVVLACRTFDHIEASRSGTQVVLTAMGTDTRPILRGACPVFAIPQPQTYRLDPPFPSSFSVVVREPGDRLDLTANVRVQ